MNLKIQRKLWKRGLEILVACHFLDLDLGLEILFEKEGQQNKGFDFEKGGDTTPTHH